MTPRTMWIVIVMLVIALFLCWRGSKPAPVMQEGG